MIRAERGYMELMGRSGPKQSLNHLEYFAVEEAHYSVGFGCQMSLSKSLRLQKIKVTLKQALIY